MWSLILTEQQLYGEKALTEIFLPKVEDVRETTRIVLMMERVRTSETYASFSGAIRRYIPEGCHLHASGQFRILCLQRSLIQATYYCHRQ
jgi:hypothetical protein